MHRQQNWKEKFRWKTETGSKTLQWHEAVFSALKQDWLLCSAAIWTYCRQSFIKLKSTTPNKTLDHAHPGSLYFSDDGWRGTAEGNISLIVHKQCKAHQLLNTQKWFSADGWTYISHYRGSLTHYRTIIPHETNIT